MPAGRQSQGPHPGRSRGPARARGGGSAAWPRPRRRPAPAGRRSGREAVDQDEGVIAQAVQPQRHLDPFLAGHQLGVAAAGHDQHRAAVRRPRERRPAPGAEPPPRSPGPGAGAAGSARVKPEVGARFVVPDIETKGLAKRRLGHEQATRFTEDRPVSPKGQGWSERGRLHSGGAASLRLARLYPEARPVARTSPARRRSSVSRRSRCRCGGRRCCSRSAPRRSGSPLPGRR